jgi:hypothetical protein
MNETARYIKVELASGPNTTKNTCGGCGAQLDEDFKHSVLDCLQYLTVKIKILELQNLCREPI